MIRRILSSLLLLLGLYGASGGVWAQARWHELPPDERRQLRQQMREHWEREHKASYEESGGARRWGDVPPEERQRMRQEIREQRGWPPRDARRREGREEPGRNGE